MGFNWYRYVRFRRLSSCLLFTNDALRGDSVPFHVYWLWTHVASGRRESIVFRKNVQSKTCLSRKGIPFRICDRYRLVKHITVIRFRSGRVFQVSPATRQKELRLRQTAGLNEHTLSKTLSGVLLHLRFEILIGWCERVRTCFLN